MSSKYGRKFPLLVYKHLVGRWWSPMIAIGLIMFFLAYQEYNDPVYRYIPMRWQVLSVVGTLAILTGLFFIILRFFAYVQPMPGYLRFVTPFLQFNLSYKRILKTKSNEMGRIFPPKSLSGWMRDILEPLAGKMAIIIELRSYPIPEKVLRTFLSRFFFMDKTIHIVILVDDWMNFSTQLESFRYGEAEIQKPSRHHPHNNSSNKNSILRKLPKK